jgi:hypothetical protein
MLKKKSIWKTILPVILNLTLEAIELLLKNRRGS